MKKQLLLKKKQIEDQSAKSRYPIYEQNGGKMAKIATQFMTKTAEKPYPLGRTYLYSPYKGVPPPGPLACMSSTRVIKLSWSYHASHSTKGQGLFFFMVFKSACSFAVIVHAACATHVQEMNRLLRGLGHIVFRVVTGLVFLCVPTFRVISQKQKMLNNSPETFLKCSLPSTVLKNTIKIGNLAVSTKLKM